MWLEKLVEIAEYYRPNINWGIDPNKKTDSDSDFIDMLRCAILHKKNEEEIINKVMENIKEESDF